MRILVTGGTGVIGRPVVDRLVRRGHVVRLLSRHADTDSELWPRGVEAHAGSVADADTLRAAAEGCEAVLHIAGIANEDPPERTFQAINVRGTELLVREAERAGVKRFVYVSSLGADRGTSAYHRSKRMAEDVVRRHPGNWLIVRPGNVMGPGDDVVSMLLKMVRTLPAVPVIGTGDHRFQPVWAEDLAEALALAVERDEPSRRVLEVAGTEVTSTSEVLDLLGEITGRGPVRMPVPEKVADAGLRVVEAFGLDVPMDENKLRMLVEENVVRGSNALPEVFGVRPTPLREALERLADAIPERLPTSGVGPLQRQRYWADLEDSAFDPDTLFRTVCDQFGALVPESLLRVDPEGRGGVRLEPDATLTMEIPVRRTVQVRVVEASNRVATLVTLEGHPLSGMIRFFVRDRRARGAPTGIRFEIRSYFRGSNRMDEALMAVVGIPVQEATWRSVVEAVVERSGGRAAAGVQFDGRELSPEEAQHVERSVEALVRNRRRETFDEPPAGRGT